MRVEILFAALAICPPPVAWALTIQVDYSFDDNHFFTAAGNPQGATGAAQAIAALEAAAARWSAIIDQPLGAVNLSDDNDDPRIRYSHPATGQAWQVSPATSVASDSLVQEGGRTAANEYRGPWSIAADTWILYTGAHDISPSAGFGGTEIGTNWNEILAAPDAVNNRGFNGQTAAGARSLPVWGGWMTFNNSATQIWHFDHTSAPPVGKTDFYTIALHEIGHALGLHTGFWYDWEILISGGAFTGANALAAYNADNGTAATSLSLDSQEHWTNDRYQSKIFAAGSPNYTGTVGAGVLQSLLMESSLPEGTRFEITNADVGALQDLGWSVIDNIVVEPTDAPADLRIVEEATGAVRLNWTAVAGASYLVQSAPDLGGWSDAATVVPNSTSAVWRDTNPPADGDKFYRVVSL